MKLEPRYTGTQWINGRWSHTWGDGTVLPVIRGGDGTDDDADGDQDDAGHTSDGADEVTSLKREAKKRRLQAREWRQRAEAAEAALAETGEGGSTSGTSDARSDVILAMVESGMKKDPMRAALKLIDWDNITDAEDAIEDLKDEHPFLFEPDKEPQADLPGTGAAHNSQRGKGKGQTRQQLEAKYAALRR